MHSPSILSNALAAHLLFMIPLVIRDSFASSTTTIQNGDTFLAIAHSAGIPVESLEAANPGVAASALYVGQVINIPTINVPAAGTPLSNLASQTAAATASTTLVTLTSPPVTSLSGSPSPAPSVSAGGLSSAFPSLIAEAGLAVENSSASMSSSSAGSQNTMTVLSSSTSSPIATTSPRPSTAAVASSLLTSTKAASTLTSQVSSSRLSSTAAAASSTSPPPAPPTTTPSSTTPASTPNSPTVASCAPTPPGKYHNVSEESITILTKKFCDAKKEVLLTDLQKSPVPILDGSLQGWNKNQSSEDNDLGFNMTINAIHGCSVQNATVGFPLPEDPNSNCTVLLFDAWRNCNNEGMGGSITAGCFIYLLLIDH